MSSVLKFTGKCLLSLFMFHQILVAGQCGGDCTSCDANTTACVADPACRQLTGTGVNPTLMPLPAQICVEIGTCDSDCSLCGSTTATCQDPATGGSRANCFISSNSGTDQCVGAEKNCQLNCIECTDDNGADCIASEVEPNGCVYDPSAVEKCVAADSLAPTSVAPTTAAPTTAAPTTAAPTTADPTTAAPTTLFPTTLPPTTVSPTTAAPTTAAPTTSSPTTAAPTTASPTTPQPTPDAEDCPDCPITVFLTLVRDLPVSLCPDNVTLGAGSSSGSFSFDSVDDSDSSDSGSTSTNATVCLVNATSSDSISLDSLDSSDSGTASSGFCGSAGGSSASDSVSAESVSTRRRRRTLLSASLSISESDSADSSSGVGGSSLVAATDVLVDTCLLYYVGIDVDCPVNLVAIFLPLCENNDTDFNSSALTADDLTALISDETFANGTNVATVRGVVIDGAPGIILNLTTVDDSGAEFILCLQNITVTADNVDDLTNLTALETSSDGLAILDTGIGCQVEGLPCFNFFFSANCPATDGSSAGSDSVSSESDDDGELDDAALEELTDLIASDLLALLG